MNDLACGIFVQPLDDVAALWWNSVVMHQFLYDFSVHTVEGVLEVDRGHVEGDCHSIDCSMMTHRVAM